MPESPESDGADGRPALLERRFRADKSQIPALIAFVAHAAERWGMHQRRRLHLQLALEEAVVNICDYAYATPPGELLVRVEPTPDWFVAELIDEGIPFDPLTVEEPDVESAIGERPIGGLGILLVRRLMDEVTYRRDGARNILRLVIGRT